MDTATKEYWGPRVWRMLHLLANISDRSDVPSVWRQLLRITAVTLPCEKCRVHFTAYLKTHSIIGSTNPTKITGLLVRETIKDNLRIFHNDVNARLGKPQLSRDEYNVVYPPRIRHEVLLEVQNLFNELKDIWTPLVHRSITQGNFMVWKNTMTLLLALIGGGST